MDDHDAMIFCFTEESISKNIFKYINSYKDFCNLASSCKFFKNLLTLSKKTLTTNNEHCYYEVSLARNMETDYEFPIIFNPFSKDRKIVYTFEEELEYLGTISNGRFNFQTEVGTEVDIEFDEVRPDVSNRVIDGLSNFINELFKYYENAKILNLATSLTSTRNDTLGRLLHNLETNKIETIKFSVQDLFQMVSSEHSIGRLTIFDGLPNLKEIYVSGFLSTAYFYRFNAGDSVLSHFIRCLSNRENCILNFSELNYASVHQESIAEYMDIVSSYGFQIKYKDEFDFPNTTYVPLIQRDAFTRNMNMFNSITSICLKIRITKFFIPIIKGVKYLRKLKEIHVTMLDVKLDDMEEVSWHHLKDLEMFDIDFCLSEEVHPIIANSVDDQNQSQIIMYFVSILPTTLTKFRMHNIYCLRSDVALFINEHLPNIEFMWAQCGLFNDRMCFENFINLKYLIILNLQDIFIPKNVELFIIELKWTVLEDNEMENLFREINERFQYLIYQKQTHSRIYFKDIFKSKEYMKIIDYFHINNPPSRYSKIPRF
uniref:F-box domain-containing protein n=1 Tax=Parastrongyloides trichosuri TaxID=131310 RepID=A0A0N4Z604_PARTI